MCIRDSPQPTGQGEVAAQGQVGRQGRRGEQRRGVEQGSVREDEGAHTHGRHTVSYTHLRAHETVLDLVCRLLLEKKQKKP
mgnify:CR=1 FL=1